jgi:hypothetical protein
MNLTARRVAAVSMIGAAVAATAGFTLLGSVFDYPAVLDEPTAEILDAYRRHQAAISIGFAVLVLAAALLVPIALSLGQLAGDRRSRRWIIGLGITAATVQVVGLSRWLVLVPGISDDALDPAQAADAYRTFERAHTWLGHALGETLGYALTAAFTIVAVRSVPAIPRWLRRVGATAAVLVATGVLVPLGLDVASLTNFAGYLLWTAWLVALAIAFLRDEREPVPAAVERRPASSGWSAPAPGGTLGS